MARKLAQRVPMSCASPAYTARHGMPNSLSELARHTCLVGNGDEWHFTLDGQPHSVRGTRPASVQQRPRPAGCGAQGDRHHPAAGLLRERPPGRGELIELLPELRPPRRGFGPSIPTTATSPQGAAAGGLSGRAAQRSRRAGPGCAPSAEPWPQEEKARMAQCCQISTFLTNYS